MLTMLTPEEEETIRTAGAAWCDEVTFDRIWATVDRLRTMQAVYETWREIASVAGLALWTEHEAGTFEHDGEPMTIYGGHFVQDAACLLQWQPCDDCRGLIGDDDAEEV